MPAFNFALTLFPFLSLVSAALGLQDSPPPYSDYEAETQAKGLCGSGLKDPKFNATGSVKRPGLLTSAEWTWHTGLLSDDLNSPEQQFWVDTTGSVDLSSRNLPYKACLSFFDTIYSIPYETSLKDNGSCETAVGKECLDAIRPLEHYTSPGDGNPCPSWFVPPACKFNSSTHVSILLAGEEHSNTTCANSTIDNQDGQNNGFYASKIVPRLKKQAQGEFDLYDLMSNLTYMMVLSAFENKPKNWSTSSSPSLQTETQFICLKNTDFAEGSRKPVEVEQPENNSGSGKNMASFGSLVVGIFVVIFVLN